MGGRYRHHVRSTCPSTSALAPTTDLRQRCPEQPVMTQFRPRSEIKPRSESIGIINAILTAGIKVACHFNFTKRWLYSFALYSGMSTVPKIITREILRNPSDIKRCRTPLAVAIISCRRRFDRTR